MVLSVIKASEGKPYIKMTDEVGQATDELRSFLFANVYSNPIAKSEDEKSKELLGRLFDYYCERPELMPGVYFRNVEDEGVKRCVCDYISSMTYRFAIDTYSALFVPRVWGGKA
jgi:dGTPase